MKDIDLKTLPGLRSCFISALAITVGVGCSSMGQHSAAGLLNPQDVVGQQQSGRGAAWQPPRPPSDGDEMPAQLVKRLKNSVGIILIGKDGQLIFADPDGTPWEVCVPQEGPRQCKIFSGETRVYDIDGVQLLRFRGSDASHAEAGGVAFQRCRDPQTGRTIPCKK